MLCGYCCYICDDISRFNTLKERFYGDFMRELMTNIHMILNLMKDFVAGYSTMSSDQMMVDYKGKRYMVTLEELCNADDEEMFVTMKRYWRR